MRLLRAICLALALGPAQAASADTASLDAISSCWDVGSASSEALRSVVIVNVSIRADGSVDAVSLVSSDAASQAATKSAYEIARRAVVRCAKNGGSWSDQVVTLEFDYRAMRLRRVAPIDHPPVEI